LAIVTTRIPGVTIAGYLVRGSAELTHPDVRSCAPRVDIGASRSPSG
jgi:hypothetical protein